ncbi:MAG: hypothetical protein ABWY29_11025 [Blastococcus sp.]
MSPSRALTRGAVLVLLSGTAACGLSSVAPKVELRSALVAFGEERSAAFTVSLPSSHEDVRAFIAATGEDDASLDDTMLEELLGTELVVAYDQGESEKKTADDDSRFQLRLDGEDYGELRVVDEVAYARVNVPGLSDRFPDLENEVDTLRADMEASDLGALAEAVDAALDGEWVSVDMGEGSWLAEQQKAMEEASGGAPSDDLAKRLRDVAGKALDSSVSVRKADDRLIATVNTRELYTKVKDDLPELLDEIAPGMGESLPPADEVPSRDVSASFWIEDGELRRIEVDFAQFLEEPTGHLVVRVDTAAGESIDAPDDAVEVDLEALIGQSGLTPEELVGGLGGLGGLGGGPGAPDAMGAEDAAMSIGYEIQAYASMDGVAPSVEYLPMIAETYAGMTPPLELLAVGDRVQVTYDGEVACLTLAPDYESDSTVVLGPC